MPLDPPTGLIRTLPAIYADPLQAACKHYRAFIARMEAEPDADHAWFIVLPTRPKHEFLHIYVLINGKIEVRFNFAGYRDGGLFKLWDGTLRRAGAIAVCAGPVSRPSEPIPMRGFRGFRYTSNLW